MGTVVGQVSSMLLYKWVGWGEGSLGCIWVVWDTLG